MISNLVAGYAYWLQCAARIVARLSTFSTASQMVTPKAPPLQRVFFCNPSRNQTVVVKVTSIPANAPSRPQLRLCVAPRKQSASVYQFVSWTFVEGLQQAKNARSARCDECLSASVCMFSSSAVKPGHQFMILNLTLEFEYLLGGCPQDETSIWGLVSAASWYTAKFWSTTPVVLCVVGTTSTSVSARSTPQTCR